MSLKNYYQQRNFYQMEWQKFLSSTNFIFYFRGMMINGTIRGNIYNNWNQSTFVRLSISCSLFFCGNLKHSLQKVWRFEGMDIHFFHLFSEPPISARLFQQYHPNEIQDKHNNKLMSQSYSLIFRRLKKMLHAFS